MTMIGAIKCAGDVVLLADRQETLTDYAKWDVNKIAHFELANRYRCLMAGAGDSNMIEMIKQQVIAAWSGRSNIACNWMISAVNARNLPIEEMRPLIVRVVREVTKKCILPCPQRERPDVDLIWAIQRTGANPPGEIDVFRTYRLEVVTIGSYYFGGSSFLLARYLSDLYLQNVALNAEEAEALAAYFLWEAKEYDPNVGKHSDIITLKQNGEINRMDRAGEQYWEEHFAYFKRSLRFLPLLSCASSPVTKHLYPKKDHLQRFHVALNTLAKEQEKMRKDTAPRRTQLARALSENLRKAAMKFQKEEQARIKRLGG